MATPEQVLFMHAMASRAPQILGRQFPERAPTDEEGTFFRRRPEVAGYAAEDQRVVMNPATTDPDMRESVLFNERIRQLLRDAPSPGFSVGQHQRDLSPEYAADPEALRKTIIARLLSGDPSAAPYSAEQQRAARDVLRMIAR